MSKLPRPNGDIDLFDSIFTFFQTGHKITSFKRRVGNRTFTFDENGDLIRIEIKDGPSMTVIKA